MSSCAAGKPKYLSYNYDSDVSLVVNDFVIGKKAESHPTIGRRLADRIAQEIDARYPAKFKTIYRNKAPDQGKYILIKGEVIEFGETSSLINQWLNKYGANKFRAKVSITDGNSGKSLIKGFEIDKNIYMMDQHFDGVSLIYTEEDVMTAVAAKTSNRLLKIDKPE
ncbi:MAG: hypothetical protein ACE5GM_07530 [bacterium]